MSDIIKFILFDWSGTLAKEKTRSNFAFNKNNKLKYLNHGALDTLEYLYLLDISMGIVSNMNSVHHDDMQKAINKSGLDKYFLFNIFSNEPGLCAKPCYDIFDLAMKHINAIDRTIRSNQVLFVGNDYINDILGASNYGFLTAYVQNIPITQYDIDVFKMGKQTFYLSSIDDLISIIN